MKSINVWSLVVLALVALMASVAPVRAEDGGTVAIPGKYRDVFFRNPEAAAAYAAATTCEGRADAIAKAATDCNADLSSCLERERVANETSAEYAEMYAKEYAQCHGVPCTPAEVKAKDPKCFPKGTSSPKPPPKVAVKYCQNLDPVLDAVAGSGVIGESDVVIVRSLSETGGVATVKCVPSYIATQKFVQYVREEFGKVCYKRTPESEAKLTDEDRKELDEQCGVAGSRIKWTGDTLDGFENLTPEVWADVYAAFITYLTELGKIKADIAALKARVGKLEERADANDVTDDDQWRHIRALERAFSKTFTLRLAVLELEWVASPVSDTPSLGVRMDLVVRPDMKRGSAGYFGFSGGRGWTQPLGGVEQPTTVTYGARMGYYHILNPKDTSPNVFALHLGGALIGAWPIESQQNISAAGGELGFDYSYGIFGVGLNLGLFNGRFARYAQDPEAGGAVRREVVGNTMAFVPSLNIGFAL